MEIWEIKIIYDREVFEMDVFMEHLVAKRKDTKDKLIISAIIFASVVLSIAMFAFMLGLAFSFASANRPDMNNIIFSIGLLLVALVWYGAYLLISTRSIEYEYIVTNNEIDIDKVMSKKGRKRLITIDVREVTCLARIDDENNNDVYKNPPAGVKVINYSAMSKNGYTYFADGLFDGERKIVLFEPTNKMIDELWKFNPKAIHRYREV